MERVRFFQDGAETMTKGVDDEYMRQCPEEYASYALPCYVALKHACYVSKGSFIHGHLNLPLNRLRFAASLKQAHTALKESRRPGRPPHPREDKIYQAGLTVDSEWTSGFWMPDLRDTENLVRLQEWDGRWGSLATIRFVRVHKEGGGITKSSFPPKGLS